MSLVSYVIVLFECPRFITDSETVPCVLQMLGYRLDTEDDCIQT